MKDPSVLQDKGNTRRIGMAQSGNSNEKKYISFTSFHAVKVPYHPNLSTIIEEKELNLEHEKRNDFSTGLSRSKLSLHSGLSALMVASEKLIEAASDCWSTSYQADEERSFSYEWPINGEDSIVF